jgi:SAM-dependent methyltransferase
MSENRRMNSNCPVCLSTATEEFSQQRWQIGADIYRLQECQTCGSAFTWPRPSDAALQVIYATSFDYRWYRDHFDAKLQDCRMRVQEYQPLLGRRVLDFGGGVGYFSQALREAGLESTTYDPYLSGPIPARSAWDTVVALHVLEHSNDLDRTMSEIKEWLVPGGRLIVAVPNFSGLGYKKLGMRWVWAQPPVIHVHHFTAAGLTSLLSRHGYEDIRVSFHERWDANNYCDVEHAERFRIWDAAWGVKPFNALQASEGWWPHNSWRRFRGLEKSLSHFDNASSASSELQITASLKL